MTIEEAINIRVRELLIAEGYCQRSEIYDIATQIAKEFQEGFDVSIAEVSRENEKLSKRVDQLYDHIQKIAEPKFPKLRNFFSFRWAKFWKNWNWDEILHKKLW